MLTVEEILRLAGPLSLDEEKAREALPNHYIFTFGRAKKKRGVCSRCAALLPAGELGRAPDPYIDEEEYRTLDTPYGWGRAECDESGLQGHFGHCPACGALAQYKSLARGTERIYDVIHYAQWRKSPVEENCLIFVLWRCAARYWGADEDAPLGAFQADIAREPVEICAVKYGGAQGRAVRERLAAADWAPQTGRAENMRYASCWAARRECRSGFPAWRAPFAPPVMAVLDKEDFLAACDGTPWACAIRRLEETGDLWDGEACAYIDKIDLIARIGRLPSLEYLAKLRLNRLLLAAVRGEAGRELRLRSRTAAKALRITPDEWGWIKGRGLQERLDLNFLRLLRLRRERGVRVSLDALWEAAPAGARLLEQYFSALGDPGLIAQGLRWMPRRGVSPQEHLDHLQMMVRLDMDMRDQGMLFPRDFAAAHAELSRRCRAVEDRATDARIQARQEGLAGYYFSALGLIARPLLSAGEINREGAALHHCVATYVARYAQGDTTLICIRREGAPGAPLFTAEYDKAGRMIQTRGDHNRIPPEWADRLAEFQRLYDWYRKERAALTAKKRASAA